MVKWSEILEQNKEEIIKKMEVAKRECLENKYEFTMKEEIEVYEDGTVLSMMMSQNSQTMDSYNGKSYTVYSYEYTGMELDSSEEIEHFKNLGLIPKELLEENDCCEIFDYIQALDNYAEEIKELSKNTIEEQVSYNTASEDFDYALSRLKELEKEREEWENS